MLQRDDLFQPKVQEHVCSSTSILPKMDRVYKVYEMK